MSVKTIEKRRKRSWHLYLMLYKGRYKTWVTSDEALFILAFITGKTKIQYISVKNRRKDAAVLQKASWSSGVTTLLRIWDCFLLEGPKVLFRFSLGVLFLQEEAILAKHDTVSIMRQLKAAAKLCFDVEGLISPRHRHGQRSLHNNRVLPLLPVCDGLIDFSTKNSSWVPWG
ncbi:uncharacterized protein TNCV_4842681 [Trichonephila clavipes]|uniref:Uncharacterized protein n=1 Tax=Trichonephila clavipes TaxID=2585209 RepID=A0A8X7BLS5_TRICX|nr:uncharacterized protein TNCV_4842681 [Trichonephila clavipes]